MNIKLALVKSFLLWAILSVSQVSVMAESASLSKSQIEKLGLKYMSAGKWQEIIDVTTPYLEKHPTEWTVLNYRQYAYMKLEMFDKALVDQNLLITSTPITYVSNWVIYDARGDLYMAQKSWKKAVDDYNMALSICTANGIGSHNYDADIRPKLEEKRRLCLQAQVPSKDSAVGNAEDLAAKIASLVEARMSTTSQQQPAITNTNTSTDLNRPIRDKWALIIGISKFSHSDYNLRYASKDALDFYKYLVDECGFAKDHVKVLLDEQATRQNIMSAFGNSWLPKVCMPDDMVIVYMSTHGTPASRDAGKKNYVVAYDTDREELFGSGVNMNDLCAQIKERVKTDRVLIVMDTCYSGGAGSGAKGTEQAASIDAKTIALGSGRLVISSSDSEQRSWESKTKANGIFTYNLLDTLRKKGSNVIDAFPELKRSVEWEAKTSCDAEQTPVLAGQWSGEKLVLNAAPTEPRTLPPNLIPKAPLQTSSISTTQAPVVVPAANTPASAAEGLEGANSTTQAGTPSPSRSSGGLGKIINSLGGFLNTGPYGSSSGGFGNLTTDPSTGFLYDSLTGNLIDPATGAVVGRRGFGGTTGFGRQSAWLNTTPITTLAALEREVFGKEYANSTIEDRLRRLETVVFPRETSDTSKPVAERLRRLTSAIPISSPTNGVQHTWP